MKNFVKIILVLAMFSWCNSIHAQAGPAIVWQKCLGSPDIDQGYSIQQTFDGGFIVAGTSNSNGGNVTGNNGVYDYWIAKLNASGNLIWQRSLGGLHTDQAFAVKQTSDSNFIVAGWSGSNNGYVSGNHGQADYWIVKLNMNGILVWQKCIGGLGDDYAYSIDQTSDGGFIIAGDSWSSDSLVIGNHGVDDFWIVKLDAEGNLVWQKSLGGSSYDLATSIQQTLDGGYLVVGTVRSINGDITASHGGADYWVVKLDSIGNLVWQKSLGGSGDDFANSAIQTSDGRFIIAGRSESYDGDVVGHHSCDYLTSCDDFWIVQIDNNGNILWQKCLGGSDDETAYSIVQTSDYGFLVAGHSASNEGDVSGNHGPYYGDCWVTKLDTLGNLMWQKCLGGSGTEFIYSIQQIADGEFIAAGWTNSNEGDVSGNHGSEDYWVVKLSCNVVENFYADADSDGYGDPNVFVSIAVCSQPDGYVSDSTDCDGTNANVNPGEQEILNNGIDDNCNGMVDEFGVGVNDPNIVADFTIHPNPVTDILTIDFQIQSNDVTIRIYDLQGRRITLLTTSTNTQAQLNTTTLADGFYTLQITNNKTGAREVEEFVKQ